ncbi:uncharacterized protein TRIADDRAFT_53591 [Trichoplax adhaerens]|uniref:SKICH domain-containing protein n=1 Tax=Trichoplax adhaerens TaxID=10228 RepID=B3RPM3_TRIAD|nr:predicted protein [Trichoplax adhaerens]EDV28215.1 predicted protein [Trichoplax adhaerens]|eukprot:XP_002110049.1 predicted protein [Trichoplax adhaerens]
MFSGMSLGSSARQLADTEEVEFTGVRACYVPGEDIVCQYRHRGHDTPSADDWVGLYKIGWRSLREYLGFHWIRASNNQDDHTLLFPASTLPKDVEDEYQLCYISKGTLVRGRSRQFKISPTVPANVTESESMLFVDLQRSTTTSNSNVPLMTNSSNNNVNMQGIISVNNTTQPTNSSTPNQPGQGTNSNPLNIQQKDSSSNSRTPVHVQQSQATQSTNSSRSTTPELVKRTNNGQVHPYTMPSVGQIQHDNAPTSNNNSKLDQSNHNGQAEVATTTSTLVGKADTFSQDRRLTPSHSLNNSNLPNINTKKVSTSMPMEQLNKMRNDKLDDQKLQHLITSNLDTISSSKTSVNDNASSYPRPNQQVTHGVINAKLELIWPLINYISDGCPQLFDILRENDIQAMHSEKARRAVNVCLENLTARKRVTEDLLSRVNQLNQQLQGKNASLEKQKELQNENSQLKDDILNLTRQLDSAKDQILQLKNAESEERKKDHECLQVMQLQMRILVEKMDKIPVSKTQPTISTSSSSENQGNERVASNTTEQSSTDGTHLITTAIATSGNIANNPAITSNVYSESFYAPASMGTDIYGTNRNAPRNTPNLSSEFTTGWQNNYETQPAALRNPAPSSHPPPPQPTSRPGQSTGEFTFTYPPPTSTTPQPPSDDRQSHSDNYVCPVCSSEFPIVNGYDAFEHHVNFCIDSSR